MKLKKIKKINILEKLKRDLLYNDIWSNYITNEKYLSNIIILDPIMDKFEINIITNINCPNNVIDKNDNSMEFQKNNRLNSNINKFYAEINSNEKFLNEKK